MVDLYSFPVPPVPQPSPSFHHVSRLPPVRQIRFQNSPLLWTYTLYLFLDSYLQQGKSEEFNKQGIKK